MTAETSGCTVVCICGVGRLNNKENELYMRCHNKRDDINNLYTLYNHPLDINQPSCAKMIDADR
jgi:hypothetical protein